MDTLCERFRMPVYCRRSTAPRILRECAAEGQTIFEADPLCRAAKEYLALTQHVMKF